MKYILKSLIVFLMIISFENAWALSGKTFEEDDPNYPKHYKCLEGVRIALYFDERYVKMEDIDYYAIYNGYAVNAPGYTEANKENYKVKAYRFTLIDKENNTSSNKCEPQDESVKVCPTSKLSSYFNTGGKYWAHTLQEDGKIKTKYSLSRKKFEITIQDVYNNQVSIRRVPNESKRNPNYKLNKKNFNNSEFLVAKDGYFHITANPGEEVWLEVYEKNSNGCEGVFITEYLFVMDSYSSIKVDNPALIDPNSREYKLCKTIKNDNTILDSYQDNLKKALVPYCYGNQETYNSDVANGKNNKWFLYLDEYYNLYNLINEGYQRLKNDFTKDSSVSYEDGSSKPVTGLADPSKRCGSGSGETKCDQTVIKTDVFIAYSDQYFVSVCGDAYVGLSDKAKLTTAGSGFSYDSNYRVERECITQFVGQVVHKKPQCSCRFVVSHTEGDLTDISGAVENNGGPDEDFDICVNKCDGGNYSQTCINSCYKEVYGNETKRDNLLEEMSFNSSSDKYLNFMLKKDDFKYSTKKTSTTIIDELYKLKDEIDADITISEPIPGETLLGNPGLKYYAIIDGGKKCDFTISDWCRERGYYVYLITEPDGCSWNPENEYRKEINRIRASAHAAFAAINTHIPETEVITYDIIDSHLTNANGSYYKFSINTESSGLKLIKTTLKGVGKPIEMGHPVIGVNDGKEDVVSEFMVKAERTIHVSLPEAYLGKMYGDIVYKTGNNNFTIKKSGNNYQLLNPFSGTGKSFNFDDYYYGDKKYFTNLYSSDLNVNVSNDSVSLVNRNACYNIDVRIDKLANRYSLTNSCYYGVYNNYVLTPDPNPVPPDPDPDPTPGQGDDPGSSPSCDSSGNCPGYGPGEKVGAIRYIFRPIELTDVFPDRSPRWNWTNSASLNLNGNDPYLGYNVNPENLTSHIQSSGNNIYNDRNELDYEIIIDRQGIARIKSFNKEMESYTNFDLNCINRGVTLCKSNFLDNAMYIRNAGRTRVNATIGTNND